MAKIMDEKVIIVRNLSIRMILHFNEPFEEGTAGISFVVKIYDQTIHCANKSNTATYDTNNKIAKNFYFHVYFTRLNDKS